MDALLARDNRFFVILLSAFGLGLLRTWQVTMLQDA